MTTGKYIKVFSKSGSNIMGLNAQNIKKNLVYTIITQIIIVITGLIKTLVLPNAFDSVESYGYWQIYMFYSSYILFFTFGFHEGVYLIYGGYDFNSLPDEKLKRAFGFHNVLMVLLMLIGISLIFLVFPEGTYQRFVYIMVIIKLPTSAVIEYFSRLFQSTNEFKYYSIYTLIDKIVFVLSMLLLLLTKQKQYQTYIIIDVAIQYLCIIVIFIHFSRFFSSKIKREPRKDAITWLEPVKAGVKIITSNYVAILATGYGRFLVEQFGDITEYAYYSLGVSILNFVLLAISAFSIILYPTLKRINETDYKTYFQDFSGIMVCLIPILLFMYYPLVFLINHLLTKYVNAIAFLPPLLGLTVIKGAMDICLTPFMKASREETNLLRVGIIGLITNVIISTPLYLITKNIKSVAYAAFIMMLIEYIIQVHILCKKYSMKFGLCEMVTIGSISLWMITLETTGNVLSAIFLFFLTISTFVWQRKVIFRFVLGRIKKS